MSDSFERAGRLKKARIERGFRTARMAAEYINVPYGTYSGHENGSRGIKEPELIHYAKVFRVTPAWLAFGEEQVPNTVRIVGVISGLDSMGSRASKNQRTREVSPPFPVPVGVTALLIATNDFAPTLLENDVVLIGAKVAANGLLNQRVALSNKGVILVGMLLTAGKANHFHIQLFNGQMGLDILPDWIAPIVGVLYGGNQS